MPATVEEAHSFLLRKGHVDPIVALGLPEGDRIAGDGALPAEIGSITKVFTGLLLAVLAAEGVVRLDDPVPAHLPPGTPLAPGVGGITLEHLASHRSGLPRLPPGLSAMPWSAPTDPYAAFDEDRVIASLAVTKVHGTPGLTRVRYSNYGAGLLGLLLGRAAGQDYRACLTERVLVPMGLTSTSFADSPLRQGHYRGRPVGPWHLAALAGAGGLRASAGDLLAFGRIVADPAEPWTATIAQTLRPRTDRGPIRPGLGWFLMGGGQVLMHDGGTLGSRTEIRIERRSGRCVVVLGDARRGTPRAAAMLLDPS